MFYEGELETGVEQPRSVLRVSDRVVAFAFGHVEGTTLSLVVNTNKGNEKSKANAAERKIVVWVWCDCWPWSMKLVQVQAVNVSIPSFRLALLKNWWKLPGSKSRILQS